MSKTRPLMKTSHFILTTAIDVVGFLVGYHAVFSYSVIDLNLALIVLAVLIVNRYLVHTFKSQAARADDELNQQALSIAPLPLSEEHSINDVVSLKFSPSKPTLIMSLDGVLHRNRNESLEYKDKFMSVISAIPNMQIILSTSWRTDCDEIWLRNKLGDDFFSHVVGYTPVSLHFNRNLDIDSFLYSKNPHKFVVLDTDSAITQKPNGLIVITESSQGIQNSDIQRIIDFFN